MPEELKEGAQEVLESPELAVPEISEALTEVQQPSPAPAGLTEERLQELLDVQRAALEETIERKVQSTKDRRIGKIESKVDELLALREQVEAAGGWDPIINQRQSEDALDARLNAILDARLPRQPASQPVPADPKLAWQKEWNAESQKILDAAVQLGVTLTTEEYNAALFGKKFQTAGDAYVALNQAILRKGRGEAIPGAAVVVEGGSLPRQPGPVVPKTFRERLDEAKSRGDDKEARRILNEQWASVESLQAKEEAKRLLQERGLTTDDLK